MKKPKKVQGNKSKNKKISSQNQCILNIIYMMLGLFALTIGYMVYFMVVKSDNFINNTYNNRHDVLTKRVIRGDILGSNGEILATTTENDHGDQIRSYPYDDVFAHIVGRYSKGRTGIEESENISLLRAEINSVENFTNELMGIKNKGNSVVTTLDVNLQKIAHNALGSDKGSVVVIEPSTGRILAMVSKPGYNPNNIDSIWDTVSKDTGSSVLINRATQGKYPPGSTFKLLTALGYIRENPDYEEFIYDCKGKIDSGGGTIHCYNNNVHGKIDLKTAFAKSCNTTFAKMGLGLDLDKFYLLSEDFYFNKSIGSNIANNLSEYTLTKENGSKSEIMQTFIGQGHTLTTPLNNAMIMAAVANDGVMMRPYVVDYITNSREKEIKRTRLAEIGTPLSKKESVILKTYLEEVVQSGTATSLRESKVKVGGKTGSAEQEGKPAHAWFTGFAPVNDPEIAIAVIVESKGTGGAHAVPIAKKVIDAYFQ